MEEHDVRRILQRLDKVENQMEDLRKWAAEITTQTAVRHADHLNMTNNISEFKTSMKADLASIRKYLTNIVWLIVAGIISGIMSFIMQGGLQVAAT